MQSVPPSIPDADLLHRADTLLRLRLQTARVLAESMDVKAQFMDASARMRDTIDGARARLEAACQALREFAADSTRGERVN